jgi:hypothetical protein
MGYTVTLKRANGTHETLGIPTAATEPAAAMAALTKYAGEDIDIVSAGRSPVYVNELGERFECGMRAFSHYSMREGIIGEPSGLGDGWFRFLYEDGRMDLFDGSRVCSLAHAERMDWYTPPAEPIKSQTDWDAHERAIEELPAAQRW